MTTTASFRGEWFRTGDRAFRDGNGRFFFDGRRSDVLKVAGENVSTVEVEAVLTAHPGVLEASVVGAPDAVRDEVPVGFVVPSDLQSPPTVEELLGWCESRLGKAKQPREITLLDELPRTSVGKIRKFFAERRGVASMTTLSDGLMAALDASIEDVSKASTLPAELYTSADVLALETEAIFMKEWLCVGRAERIPNVGDWFTVTIVDEPLIIARNKAGDVCAMSAVCQHRAMQVCEGEGNSTTFKCPYHHWNYGLDGRLLGAPAMERTEAFNKADFGLPQLRVEEWLGFVFVNFDQDASPLAPTLERYSPFVHNYDLENAVCPWHLHLGGNAVELESDVRELQRRLSRQPAARVRAGFLPVKLVGLPCSLERRLKRHLSNRRIHAHRRWFQRHTPRDHGGLPRPDGGRTDTFDVCTDATDAVLRYRTGPMLLLPHPSHRSRDD